MKVHRNASLKNFNTFNVDEKARILFEINNISDLSNILSKEAQKDEILVLGGGSNILFTKSFDGIIINIKNRGIKLIEEDENTVLVEVSAGENWHELVLFCIENQFSGIANTLTTNEHTIINELNSIQGKAINIGGYYLPNSNLADNAMRPSKTLNSILENI